MDYVVLNLYDGIMDFFESEEEALRAAALSLEECRHLGPWATAFDGPEVLVMQVTRRINARSMIECEEHAHPMGRVTQFGR